MKTLFKRLTTVFLAMVMVVTMLPAFAMTAEAADSSTGDKLLFAYFSGDDTKADSGRPQVITYQRIRFAVSDNGTDFSPLHANLPVLSNEESSTMSAVIFNGKWGKYLHTNGARDPFIINKRDSSGNIIPGQYYVVATDLAVGVQGYNNTKMLVWNIDDLSKVEDARPWVIETAGMFGNNNTLANNNDAIAWAPEVTWDYSRNQYAMFWSGPTYSDSRINVAYTSDFRTFNTSTGATINGDSVQPETLFSVSGAKVIDANINYENGKYYMVFKREDGSEKGKIYFVSATSLAGLKNQTPVRFYESVNNGDPNGLEGPEVFKRPDGHWVLIADEYNKNPECAFAMYDLGTSLESGLVSKGGSYDHRQDLVSTNINDCVPRHGGIATISATEFDKLNNKLGGYNQRGNLVAQYFTTSDVTKDASGHNFNLTTVNGVMSVPSFGGKENVAYFSNDTKKSNDSNVQYAYVDTANMYAKFKFNQLDGMTIMWDAFNLGHSSGTYTEYANFFNISKYKTGVGKLTEDKTNWTQNQWNYIYYTTGLCGGVAIGPQTAAGCNRIDPTGKEASSINGWHSFKAVIGHGGMQLYRDNKLISTLCLDGVTTQWFKDTFTDGRLNLGASLFTGDAGFNGYISDLRIYSTSNPDNIKYIDENPDTVNEIVARYEQLANDIIESGEPMDNMKPAYDAYVKYNAAIDAIKYGGADIPQSELDALLADLDAKTDAMGVHSNAEANAIPTFSASSGTLDQLTRKYYSNILYSSGVSGTRGSSTSNNPTGYACNMSGDKVRVCVYYGQTTVVLDDGKNEMLIPAMISVNPTAGSDRYVYTVIPVTAVNSNTINPDIYLINSDGHDETLDWKGGGAVSGGVYTADFYFAINDSKCTSYVGQSYGQTSRWSNQVCTGIGKGDYRRIHYYASAMKVNPNLDYGTRNVKTITNLPWKFWAGSSNTVTYSDVSGSAQSTSTIYIINAHKLTDLIASNKTEAGMVDISQFKEGGISDANAAIQQALDINYNIDFSTDTANKINSLNNQIASAETALKTNTPQVDSEEYQAIRDAMDDDIFSESNGDIKSARQQYEDFKAGKTEGFTEESVEEFIKQYEAAQAKMRAPYEAMKAGTTLVNGVPTYNVDGAYDDTKFNDNSDGSGFALDSAYNGIMPTVVVENLENKIEETKNELFNISVMNGEKTEQVLSMKSWKAVYDKIKSAEDVAVTADPELTKTSVEPKYDTKTASGNDSATATVTDFSSPTQLQKDVNEQNIILQDTAVSLAPVDSKSSYEAFDSTMVLADSVAEEKYTPAAMDKIKEAKAAASENVYFVLPDDELKEYNDVTGDNIPSGFKFKLTTTEETDAYTKNILEAIGEINDEDKKADYIKQYKAKQTTQTDGENGVDGEVQTKYYGEQFDFSASPSTNQHVEWAISYYPYGSDIATANPTSSSKLSSANGKTEIARTADSDMVVTANIVNGASDGDKLVKIYNAYGIVIGLESASASTSASAYEVPEMYIAKVAIPFYTFKEWSAREDEEGIIDVKPIYDAKSKYDVTVNGSTNAYEYNTSVTITSSDANFYAWASKVGDTYSIASYNSSYKFWVVGDEEFVPVINDGGVYKINGTAVTADMVALDTSFDYSHYKRDYKTDSGYMTADDYVQAKLAAKAPFVAVQRTDVKDGKNYVYARVTEGAKGVVVKLGDDTTPRGIANILTTGQFTVSSKTYTKFTVGVTYDFAVTFAGTNTETSETVNVSVTDYAAPATV